MGKLWHVTWLAGPDHRGDYIVRCLDNEIAIRLCKQRMRATQIGEHAVQWYAVEITEQEGVLVEILDW